MALKPLPPRELLHQLLRYDAEIRRSHLAATAARDVHQQTQACSVDDEALRQDRRDYSSQRKKASISVHQNWRCPIPSTPPRLAAC